MQHLHTHSTSLVMCKVQIFISQKSQLSQIFMEGQSCAEYNRGMKGMNIILCTLSGWWFPQRLASTGFFNTLAHFYFQPLNWIFFPNIVTFHGFSKPFGIPYDSHISYAADPVINQTVALQLTYGPLFRHPVIVTFLALL